MVRDAKSDAPIDSAIKRLCDPDNPDKFLPTITLKVAFKDENLPQYIIFSYIRIAVDYFIPRPKQCSNCGRLST